MSPTIETVGTFGERQLIERLRRRVGRAASFVVIGIGDDAAAIEPERGMLDVVTTDCLVEGIHFRRDWTAAVDIGHKALAVNLSDLAAMGAKPRACLLSLVLPDEFPLADFDQLLDGFVGLSEASGAPLVGGNLTRSPGPLVITVTALGFAHRRRLLRRDRARAGDELYVTGAVGGAAAGLAMLLSGRDCQDLDDRQRTCVARYEHPEPRLRCGSIVARSRAASACMDLSDGLADAATQMAAASAVGVLVESDSIPVEPGARDWARACQQDPVTLALAGGEDYELAFAVPPRRRRAFLAAVGRCPGLKVSSVGKFVKEPGAWLVSTGSRAPLPAGFHHF